MVRNQKGSQFRLFTQRPIILKTKRKKKKKKKRIFIERTGDHMTWILQSTQISSVRIRVSERRVRRTERVRHVIQIVSKKLLQKR